MSRFGTLVAKELRVEARSRELLTGAALVALLVVLIGSLAWGDAPDAVVIPGLLWTAVVFAGILSIGRSLHRERDRGTWDALALLPVDWGSIFLAKVVANAAVLLVVEALLLPLVAVAFDAPLTWALWPLALVLGLGTLGFAAAGTLLAAAGGHGRAREILLPVLLLPILVPLLMMALSATSRILLGEGVTAVARELQLLAAFAATFLAVGWLAFDHLLGD